MAAEGEMTCRKNEGWGCIHGSKWRLYGDLEVDDEGCKVQNGDTEKDKKKKKGKKGKSKKAKGKKKNDRSELNDGQDSQA